MSEVNGNSHHPSSYASVIQHYKKQLIHRQHDCLSSTPENSVNNNNNNNNNGKEVSHHRVSGLEPPGAASLINNGNNYAHHQVIEIDDNADDDDDDNNVNNYLCVSNNNNNCKLNSNIYEKKVRRRKRKNKNCRGQYRHETMELIKLGTTYPTLCKNNNNNIRINHQNNEKSSPKINNNNEYHVDQKEKSEYTNKTQEKTITSPLPSQITHTLPQMVPERRKSREKPPEIPPNNPRPPPPPATCMFKSSLYHPRPIHQFQHHPVIQSTCSRPAPPPPQPPPPYPKREPPLCPVAVRPQSPSKFYPPPPEVFYRPPPPPPPQHFYPKKRKREEVSSESEAKHKCHCECGKTVNCAEKNSMTASPPHQVPTTFYQDVFLKGVLVVGRCPVIVDRRGQLKNEQTPEIVEEIKHPHVESKEKEKALFLIKDIIAKPQHAPPSVIVNRGAQSDQKPPPTRTRSVDHSVDALLSPTRRRSADFDTISISSSCSTESAGVVPSLVSGANLTADKSLIPHGKLVYLPEENILLRYYVDTQKKMFMEGVSGAEHSSVAGRSSEVVKLPQNTKFNSRDNLSVEDYVNEMTLVERLVPRDFFHFYKFVTGYQICNHNLPVSFLTFLRIYNTDGLKDLLERYVRSFSKNIASSER